MVMFDLIYFTVFAHILLPYALLTIDIIYVTVVNSLQSNDKTFRSWVLVSIVHKPTGVPMHPPPPP